MEEGVTTQQSLVVITFFVSFTTWIIIIVWRLKNKIVKPKDHKDEDRKNYKEIWKDLKDKHNKRY